MLACGGQCLSLCGEWRMPLLPTLQRAASYLEFDPAVLCKLKVSHLQIDLTGASYLDSTIFGMLAGMAQRYRECADRLPVLHVNKGFVWETVKTLSFDQLFKVVLCERRPAVALGTSVRLFAWPDATGFGEKPDTSGLDSGLYSHRSGPGKAVLEAHETLARLSEENHRAFCPVVDALHRELTSTLKSDGK